MFVLDEWVKKECSEDGYKDLQIQASEYTNSTTFNSDFQNIWKRNIALLLVRVLN